MRIAATVRIYLRVPCFDRCYLRPMFDLSKLGLALCMTGCLMHSMELTSAGSTVRVMKSDPAPECVELGSALGDGCCGIQMAQNNMRNKAAQLGANYVRWDTVDGVGNLAGTAYRCPVPSGPPGAVSEAGRP